MLIRRTRRLGAEPKPSEITPRGVWLRRRDWLGRAVALASAGAVARAAGAAAYPSPGALPALPSKPSMVPGAVTVEKITDYVHVSTYNNFYEFGTDKSSPARLAAAMPVRPWSVVVDGLVRKPKRLDVDALLKLSALEERIYRFRCVEGWSMVVPWVGYSLSELIKQVEPLGSARFLVFESMADAKVMPGVNSRILNWPYVEGLRLDEALHPLTLLAFGMYGEVLPKQNGAPLRLVVPWKYGFKSAKSLVRIRFVEHQPQSSWSEAAPQEYGFYSNVNPQVSHPRWSQASERRLGEDGLFAKRRRTLMFNGYEDQVASLYAGMDLRVNF